MNKNKYLLSILSILHCFQQKGLKSVENNDEEIIAEFIKYLINWGSSESLDTPEQEKAFDESMRESIAALHQLMPDLNEEQNYMVRENLMHKVERIHLRELPTIPKKYLDLVDQAYERYLLYQQNARKNLDNLLGSTFALLFLCVLYFFSQPII